MCVLEQIFLICTKICTKILFRSNHLEVAVFGEPGDLERLLAIESPNLTRRPFLIEKERSR